MKPILLAIVAIWVALALWRRFGSAELRLGTFATITVPRRARLEPPGGPVAEEDGWISFRLSRYHAWAIGSNTPYRSSLFVNIHEAGSTSFAAALRDNVSDLNGGDKDGRLVTRDDRWVINSGIYDVNLLEEPVWRIEYHDPDRRISVLWQVFQKDWELEAAKEALIGVVASFRLVAEPDYAEIRDRPRRLAEENERKHRAALDWLAARGYGTLAPAVPVTVDDVIVEYQIDPERRLTLFRLVAAPPDSVPEFVIRGQRVWADSGWTDELEGDRGYYPSPGIRAMLAERLSRPGPHHYLIRTIRLDETAEADFRIADYFEFTRRP